MNFTAIAKVVLSLWAVALTPAAFANPSGAALNAKNYRVGELIGILSPVSFQCRLDGYEPVPNVRFQVYVRGVLSTDASNQDTAFLSELLNKARQIELRNPQFRNYFRVEADVWVDGVSLSQTLIQQNPAMAARQEEPGEKAVQRPQLNRTNLTPPGEARGTGAASRNIQPPQYLKVPLEGLLNTTVNCSMLRAETPFSEALEMLCSSVTPRLPLVVLWSDLETNTLIARDTPIGVEGFGRMRLALAIDTVLRSVAAGQTKPILVLGGGIVTLGTPQTFKKQNKTQVISVADLLMPPSQASEVNPNGYGGQGRGYGR